MQKYAISILQQFMSIFNITSTSLGRPETERGSPRLSFAIVLNTATSIYNILLINSHETKLPCPALGQEWIRLQWFASPSTVSISQI